mmetsp:Transcript_88960/g.247141  ORF Transcript_88960/g.247141 Transcript_88960/m.247141 type:complete len:187 (+) Transcript_88960:96-656(+)
MHFPFHSGPAADCAKRQVNWMVRLLCGQALVCFARFWYLWDIWGGFVMGLSIALGYYTVREEMNITLVCVWGLANAYEAAWDSVTGLVSLVLFLVSFKLTQCLIIMVIPIAELMAASFAWELFKEYEFRGGMLAPLFQKPAYAAEGTALEGSGGKSLGSVKEARASRDPFARSNPMHSKALEAIAS